MAQPDQPNNLLASRGRRSAATVGKLGQRKRSDMVATTDDMMSQILRERNEEQARYKLIFGTKDFEFDRAPTEKKWALASSQAGTKQSGTTPLLKGATSARGGAPNGTEMTSPVMSEMTTDRRKRPIAQQLQTSSDDLGGQPILLEHGMPVTTVSSQGNSILGS